MFKKMAEESELFDKLNQFIQDGAIKTDERYSHFDRMFTEGTEGCSVSPTGVIGADGFDASKLDESSVPATDTSQVDFPFSKD